MFFALCLVGCTLSPPKDLSAEDETASTADPADPAALFCDEPTLYPGDLSWPEEGAGLCDSGEPLIIDGALTVSLDASDLYGLWCLCGIVDTLTIDEVSELESLAGLENLHTVGVDLRIRYNPSLTSAAELVSLHTVGDDLLFGYNDVIVVFEGMNTLTTASGFQIFNNASLERISGLSALTRVDILALVGNDELTHIEGFDSLIEVTDQMDVSNPVQQSMAGFSSLERLNDLRITRMPMTDLQWLRTLKHIDYFLAFDAVTALISVDGLENLERIGGTFFVSENSDLSDLSALHTLEAIDGSLKVHQNPALLDEEIAALVEAIGEDNIGGLEVSGNGPD